MAVLPSSLRRDVSPATMVVLVLVGALLGAVLSLPRADTPVPDDGTVGALRAAVVEGVSVAGCVHGVEDDLFLAEPGRWAPVSVRTARGRLAGCAVEAFSRQVHAIEPPPTLLVGTAESGTIVRAWAGLRALVGSVEHAVMHLEEEILLPPSQGSTHTAESALEDMEDTTARASRLVSEAAATLDG